MLRGIRHEDVWRNSRLEGLYRSRALPILFTGIPDTLTFLSRSWNICMWDCSFIDSKPFRSREQWNLYEWFVPYRSLNNSRSRISLCSRSRQLSRFLIKFASVYSAMLLAIPIANHSLSLDQWVEIFCDYQQTVGLLTKVDPALKTMLL
jgi:hypothetical protein